MFRKAVVDAYVKKYGYEGICREVFAQNDLAELKAIQALFGSYSSFLEVVAESKPTKVVATKPKTPAAAK